MLSALSLQTDAAPDYAEAEWDFPRRRSDRRRSAVQIAIYLQARRAARCQITFPSPPPPPPTSAPVPGWCFSVTKCKPASRFISLRADWICNGRRRRSCLKEANPKRQDMIMHAGVIVELMEGQRHTHTHEHIYTYHVRFPPPWRRCRRSPRATGCRLSLIFQ